MVPSASSSGTKHLAEGWQPHMGADCSRPTCMEELRSPTFVTNTVIHPAREVLALLALIPPGMVCVFSFCALSFFLLNLQT